ncbi:unnamed protein product [Jaminaea pallidilutea]
MAGLIVASAIAAQPTVSSLIDRTKASWKARKEAQREAVSSSSEDEDDEDDNGDGSNGQEQDGNADKARQGGLRKKLAGLRLGGAGKAKGKQKASEHREGRNADELVDSTAVVHVLALLALTKWLRESAKRRSRDSTLATPTPLPSATLRQRSSEEQGTRDDQLGEESQGDEQGGLSQTLIDGTGSSATSDRQSALGDLQPQDEKQQQQQRGTDDLELNLPQGEEDEHLPSYSASVSDPTSQPSQLSHEVSQSQWDANSLWLATSAEALARLELFCLGPLSDEKAATSQLQPSSSHGQGQSKEASRPLLTLPESMMPPDDVLLAWAAVIAGPALRATLCSRGSSLSALLQWKFPLDRVPKKGRAGDLSNGAAASEKDRLRANEKGQASADSWTRSTSTPFEVRQHAGGDQNVLSRGLRIHCPSRTCSFSAYVGFLGAPEMSGGTTSASKRGFVQRGWRRRCQDCGQLTSQDTLVGRRLIEDIEAWCRAQGSYDDASAFSGIAFDEHGELDSAAADVLASQILAPLFQPALSDERRRRMAVHSVSGSLASSGHSNAIGGNSLGSVLRDAASITFSTTPYTLGESLSWSYTSLRSWIVEHTLRVNPTPALAGARNAGSMSDHPPVPDRMGGGFSAGGPTFDTGDNPFETEGAKMSAVSSLQKRDRLVGLVEQMLAPYDLLKDEGQPSARHTFEAQHSAGDQQKERQDSSESAWTDVLVAVRRPWKDLLVTGKEVVQMQNNNSSDDHIDDDGSDKDSGVLKVSQSFAHEAQIAYRTALRELRSSRPRRGLKREALMSKDLESVFSVGGAPAAVRVARLAHELTGADAYDEAMRSWLGCVPRGVLGRGIGGGAQR